ncbi:diacylglycerol/lipid kinase family protein [Tersicoccus solisilvae]|uniref:diacylglycerol/lipid kinase family protein n=1 Tax=Tersicoccus solisilvae TaxID=1882339 RepID=UPI001E3C089B|nr:diacylglycerol kinase family protein [Tersicoccus solisilvae]
MRAGRSSVRARLIVNPTARRGRAAATAPRVEDVLRSHGWAVQTTLTTSARHAVEVAERADPEDLLVALGGDGLLARVAEGALASGALVAPLPAGRGCDFIRAIGGSRDPMIACAALPAAVETRVDVGLAGDRPFLGVATVGYDSAANRYANAAPAAVPSALVYAWGGARALATTRATRWSVDVDGRAHEFDGWNVAIGNSGRYGAGMKVNPAASLTDGLLDVTTVEGLPRWRYPFLLPRLYAGSHIDGVTLRADRGAAITVHAPARQTVYADGDVVGRTPMTFTVLPGALRVLSATV